MRTVDTVKFEEKRAQILAAAERCFARRGFHAATIAQVCEEAKISPGHLYHYFESKEAMITAIAEAGLAYTQTRLAEFAVGKTDAIAVVVEELAKLRVREKGSGILLDVLAEAARDPRVGEILTRASEAMRLLLAEFVRDAQRRGEIETSLDPQMAAAIFISLIDAGRALSVRCPELDVHRFGETMEAMLRRFLAPRD